MNRNTAIKTKISSCPICSAKGDDKPKPLIGGKCQFHYQMERTRVSAERKVMRQNSTSKKRIGPIDDLSDLIDDADAVFSRYIRLKYADENGYVNCYTSGEWIHYKEAQCGHFISRSCYYLRWDERNARVQSGKDNVALKGNLAVFAKKLEEENPGIVEILEQESNLVFSLDRETLRSIISEYTQKLNKLGYK